MDQTLFEQELLKMDLFPAPLLQYAKETGAALDDAKREDLLAKLKDVYTRFEPLQKSYMELEQKLMSEIESIRKEKMPAIQKGMEDMERESAIGSINFDK